MTVALTDVFAVALGIVLYTYLAYPLLMAFLPLSRQESIQDPEDWPKISVLIAAYNEERHIAARVANLLAASYPSARLEILIGSDGSTDRTVELARRAGKDRVTVLDFVSRSGKPSVLKRLAARATGEILVLTDANTRFAGDAFIKLVRGFSDRAIGGVCGRLVLEGARSSCEGIYWGRETKLKVRESLLDSCIGANGAIYAVRREAWPEFPDSTLVDDLVIPLRMRERGWRTIFLPEAVAYEEAPRSVRDEMVRRIRLGAGGFQAIGLCWRSLLFWRGPYVWAFWSHKILRWVSPFCLLALLALNPALISAPPFDGLLALQAEFYLLAALGASLKRRRGQLLWAPYYFVAMNLALLLGFFRFVSRRQPVAWQKAVR